MWHNISLNRDKTVTSHDIRKKNLDNLHHKLQHTDWGFLDHCEDMESKFSAFHQQLTEAIDNFCPMWERKIKYKNIRHEPWLTSGVMISIKKCKKLYKNSIRADKTSKEVEQYVNYNTCLRKVKRGAKKLYYMLKWAEFKHNTKKLWGTINKICGKSNDKSMCIESLKVDNVMTYNTTKITDSFGEYFVSVGKRYADKIVKSKTNVDEYLSKIQISENSIFLNPVTYQELDRLIDRLPNKVISRYDNVSNILLKNIKPWIVSPLVGIFIPH